MSREMAVQLMTEIHQVGGWVFIKDNRLNYKDWSCTATT